MLRVIDIPENNPPEGPPFQVKVWDRKFQGAAILFKSEDGWLEWRGGDASVNAEGLPKQR